MGFSEEGYIYSNLIKKLKKRQSLHKSLKIAFLDIDSTMTGTKDTTNATRKTLEQDGYAIAYVTARTEEMLMSSTEYELSKKLGFKRPPPHLGIFNGKRVYAKPELIEHVGLLDPDIIAGSTGTQILLHQSTGGYISDKDFEASFKETPQEWRQYVWDLINSFNKFKKKAFHAPNEIPSNYHDGLSDIYRPKYRISLLFQSAKEKTEFRSFIRQAFKNNPKFTNIRITDDSEPKKDLHTLYITPKNAGKRKAVDQIIKMVTGKLAVPTSDLHVLIAGDGHSDLDMGMKAACGTNTTFLLAGGSRLMHALTCKNKHADLLEEDLEDLKNFLYARKIKGYYDNKMHSHHKFIICDEVNYGKKEAASLLPIISKLALN